MLKGGWGGSADLRSHIGLIRPYLTPGQAKVGILRHFRLPHQQLLYAPKKVSPLVMSDLVDAWYRYRVREQPMGMQNIWLFPLFMIFIYLFIFLRWYCKGCHTTPEVTELPTASLQNLYEIFFRYRHFRKKPAKVNISYFTGNQIVIISLSASD